MIEIISEPHNVICPSCDIPIATMEGENYSSSSGRPHIEDGDTIPGLWDRLSDQQKEKMFDYALEIGHCHKCHGGFYFAACNMLSAPYAEDGIAAEIVRRNVPVQSERYLSLRAEGTSGYVSLSKSRLGTLACFNFGPYRLEAEAAVAVTGPYGVSICQSTGAENEPWKVAANIVLRFWNDMRQITDSNYPPEMR